MPGPRTTLAMNIAGRLACSRHASMALTAHKTQNTAPIATATDPRPAATAVHPTLTHQSMITYIEQEPSSNYSPSKIANSKRS